MTPAEEKTPWSFTSTNRDPYTRPVRFPTPFQTADIKAVAIEIEKNAPAAGDRLELFFILDNGKSITLSQRLDVALEKGRHRYVFETAGLRWFTGKLTALRIDPGTAPGEVSIKSIGIFTKNLPPPEAQDVPVPVPADMKASLGPAFDTYPDAALVRYRLSSDYIDYAILQNHQGQSRVVKLHIRNSGKTPRADIFHFAATRKLQKPFTPVIPPYIGLNADTFSIRICLSPLTATAALAGKNIQLKTANDSTQTLAWEDASVKQGRDGWREFSWLIPDAGNIPRQITNIQLVSNTTPETDEFFFVAQPVLTGKGFFSGYNLLTPEAPMMTTGMETPLASRPARNLPVRDTLTLGGYDIHVPALRDSIPALAAFIKKEFPAQDFILAPIWTPPLMLAKELPTLPDGIFYQLQKAQFVPDYLIASGLMPRDSRGETLKNPDNFTLATAPVVQAALDDEIDYGASLGINNFKQVDYAWPYTNGRWGYDQASVAAYRSALAGTDEGLKLLPGLPGGGKLKQGGVIHFPDYYEYYHGFRPKPADLGLKNWSAYTPVSEQQAASGGDFEKRNLGAFILLYHYEWLRQAQRFGRRAKAHGGTHSYTLNPEDLGNGGDYVFLTFLADAGTPYIEYFGGPSVLKGAYHNLPLYVHAANLANKKLGAILELGQAGHGQHYFDPEINYLYAWELAAAGLRNYHNEWTEQSWLRMSDPANAYLFDRWSNWMTGAFGFTFAREEQASHPESRVFNISQRSPGYYVSSWIWGLNQGPSFGPLLAENHLLYKQYDRSALPEILNTADVIFYSPVSGRHQDWKLLREWLQTPGKTLVTHSNTPFLFDDGLARLTPGTENVNYTDINQRYSDFLMEKADFKSVVFPEFRSLRPLANGVWSTIPGASVLSDDKTNPLLSSLLPSHGSRIFYLHKNPLHLSPDERDQVVRILMEKLNLSRSINTSSVPVMAHRFVLPEAEVLNVWTGVDIPGFRGGYGSHLFPGRGADTFDRRKRPYPWLAENRQVFLEIPVNEPGTWRVYAFLSGKEQLIEAGPAKTLRLEVNNVLAEQFYYARDSLSIREKIESLKKRRERLFPWCPDIPR